MKKAESSTLPWYLSLCLISADTQTKSLITEVLEQAPHPPVSTKYYLLDIKFLWNYTKEKLS